MRNIKMGWKMGIGFGLVILIMFVLSLMAIRAMDEQENNAQAIVNTYMPELVVGVRAERGSWGAMAGMLRYLNSEDPEEMRKAQNELNGVAEQIKEAEALVAKYPQLDSLRQAVGEVKQLVEKYFRLIRDTTTIQESLKQRRGVLAKTGDDYMAAVTKLLTMQEQLLREEITSGAPASNIQRRVTNVDRLNKLLNLGAAIRLSNLRSQVMQDTSIAERGMENFEPMAVEIRELQAVMARSDTQEQLRLVSQYAETYREDFRKLIEEWKGLRTVSAERGAVAATLVAKSQDIARNGVKHTESACEATLDTAKSSMHTLVVGMGIGLLVGLVLTVWLTRLITGPLRKSVHFAQSVAGGELGNVLDIHQRDEVGQLADALNAMVDNLRGRIEEAQEATAQASAKQEEALAAMRDAEAARAEALEAKRQGMLDAAGQLEDVVAAVSSASEELSAQVEQSERGTQDQASRVGETATAMEEMNATVLEVAKNAGETADVSEQAKQKAQAGAEIVDQVIGGMHRISKSSEELRNDMAELSNKAASIGTILNVISDIADQTNLLALNAAIEAARAGEAGRGFAVVADEVRKLAEKTMKATSEVGEAIQGIQQGTAKNVSNVEASAGIVTEVTELASRSGQALTEIVSLVDRASDQVRAIATASEEQSATSEEINRAVEDISRISTETAEAMRQSSQAVMDLSRQTQVLKQLIDDMKDA